MRLDERFTAAIFGFIVGLLYRSSKTSASPTIETARGESQLLHAYIAHWIHEDNLYWAQVRHLLVLQVAALAAWHTVDRVSLSTVLMFSAALISSLLWRLALTISLNRDANRIAMKVLSINLATHETARLIRSAYLSEKDYEAFEKWGLLRIARHDLSSPKDAGRRFQASVFLLCIAIDFMLGILGLWGQVDADGIVAQFIHDHFKLSWSP